MSGAVTNDATTEDDSSFSLDLLTEASDADASDVLGVSGLTLVSGDASGITDNGTSLGIDPSAYNSLAAGETAVISFSYNVTDGNGGVVAQTAVITITGVNDVPIVSGNVISNVTEDDSNFSLDLLENASDADLTDNLGVSGLTLVSGDDSGVTDNGTSLGIDLSAYQSLAAGESAIITFNYNVIDGNGGVVAQTAVITITGVNDAPTVTVPGAISATENGLKAGIAVAADANGLLANARDSDGTNGALAISRIKGDTAGVGQAVAVDIQERCIGGLRNRKRGIALIDVEMVDQQQCIDWGYGTVVVDVVLMVGVAKPPL